MSTTIYGEVPRAVGRWQAILVMVSALAVMAVAVTGVLPPLDTAVIVGAAVAIATLHRPIFSWPVLLCTILVVIMFIPIRRYSLPVDLPFDMEPYRAIVAFIVVGWLASLLVDRRVQLRASGLEAPLGLLILAVALSVALNSERVNPVGTEVIKGLTFLASFLLVFYLVVSLVRTRRMIDLVAGTLVLCGAVVGFFALIEARTGWNIFNELGGVVPFLDPIRLPDAESRGGRLRTFGSAQHPIALGAALAMLFPLALYFAKRSGRRIWWVPAGLIATGVFATVSRTSVMMLLVAGTVLLFLRPRDMRKLIIPVLIAAPLVLHLALPGTMGSLKNAFLPEGGLVAEQQKSAGQRGAGRVADLGPALDEYAKSPVIGQGYSSRVTDGPLENADILDNQWLKSLLEIGIVGVIAWVWLFCVAMGRLGKAARGDPSPDGWLPAALAAAIAAFAVGMVTFDAFSFIQVTFLMFIMLALGACTTLLAEKAPEASESASEVPRKGEIGQ
jgi:hypothetical protein